MDNLPVWGLIRDCVLKNIGKKICGKDQKIFDNHQTFFADIQQVRAHYKALKKIMPYFQGIQKGG